MAATQREKELEAEVERLRHENAELKERVRRLEELLAGKAKAKGSKPPRFGENYSLTANEAKLGRRRRRRKGSSGRRPAEDKAEQVGREVDVYPPDADPAVCALRGRQCAWRFIDGRAVYVQYHLYAPADAETLPLPPGVRNRRSEYGVEIVLTLAFLHYWIGISLDNARQVMNFFTGLKLQKSQADSLLSQLADDWNEDYDAIAELIALQMIVYVDETGWKVGARSCYTWAFTTAGYVLFRCGVGRGKEEATAILGDCFPAIGVSDDYAAYRSLFTKHQLCWAHLLRKAIKLALQNSDNSIYARFLDRLYAIYRRAVRYQKDRRFTAGRAAVVTKLKASIRRLCDFADYGIDDDMPEHVATYIRLHEELVDNLDCLFVFVEHPEVAATNNDSERTVRREAEVRKGGRTSKTQAGAQRRSVIITVFASLRTRLESFTLSNVVAEIDRWISDGVSIFRAELANARASPAAA